MFSKIILFSTALSLTVASFAVAQTNDTPFSTIEANVELHDEAPYIGEPLRLVIKSAIHAQVANDRIIQPDLTNFDWQQFGVDTVTKEFIDGFWMPVISRVLMIYPLRPGKLTIDPFRRHVTYYRPDGTRSETEIISNPVTINVRSHDTLAGAGDFWIPARNLFITDDWATEPDQIPFGETTYRTITVEADGLTADRLPNIPSFRAPGIITFAGPVHRETIITDHGPLGRAVYRWRIRPASKAVAVAPSVKIRWFDVIKRQMRETVIPERRVAFVESNIKKNSPEQNSLSNYLSARSIIAFLLAALLTGAASFVFFSLHLNDMALWRDLLGSFRLFALLALFAWRDDIPGFYSILDRLIKTDPITWRTIKECDRNSALFNDLETAIYSDRPTTISESLTKRAARIFKIYLTTRLQPRRLDLANLP